MDNAIGEGVRGYAHVKATSGLVVGVCVCIITLIIGIVFMAMPPQKKPKQILGQPEVKTLDPKITGIIAWAIGILFLSLAGGNYWMVKNSKMYATFSGASNIIGDLTGGSGIRLL